MAEIRNLRADDARFLWEHLRRIVLESGRDGDFVFAPIEEFEVPFEDFEEMFAAKFAKPVSEKGWERHWVVADADKIYGELKLCNYPAVKSGLHRATLMMAIERSHRGRGFGSALIEKALAWAREQETLEWVQLWVFEQNLPAKKLYRKFGFKESGTVFDAYRVFGQSLADTCMVLRLR